jgi:hypothetical protein
MPEPTLSFDRLTQLVLIAQATSQTNANDGKRDSTTEKCKEKVFCLCIGYLYLIYLFIY